MTRLVQRLGLTRYEADEHYKQALALYKKRQLNEAIIEIGYAIELLPTNSEYLAARGFFYLEDGITKEAGADFEAALKIYPYEMLAHYGRGMIAYQSKNWDEAIAHFGDAYRADPQRPETLYYLALAYHRKGQNALALSYMQQAASRYDEIGDTKSRRSAERWVKELAKLAE